MRIFDLHTHILPQIDDGASNMQQSLEMIRNAAASDVEALAVTPHSNISGLRSNYHTEELIALYNQLCEFASDIPVKLFLGAEVRVSEDIALLLKKRKLLTLNNSRYLLTEFPNQFDKNMFCDVLSQIMSEGYIPLIAHPERYTAVSKEPYIVEDWLNMGCHIQLTGDSVMGRFGKAAKSAADYLLKNDLVCCIASDAHGTQIRSNFLSDVYTYLSIYYGKRYAEILMWDNPERICNNELL